MIPRLAWALGWKPVANTSNSRVAGPPGGAVMLPLITRVETRWPVRLQGALPGQPLHASRAPARSRSTAQASWAHRRDRDLMHHLPGPLDPRADDAEAEPGWQAQGIASPRAW